jgi:hypothetical protein
MMSDKKSEEKSDRKKKSVDHSDYESPVSSPDVNADADFSPEQIIDNKTSEMDDDFKKLES